MMGCQNETESQRRGGNALCITAVGDRFRLEEYAHHKYDLSLMTGDYQTPCTKTTFYVDEEECDEMIASLENEKASWDGELKYLSRSWVKAVMSQPYNKNEKIRRPFNYAKKKIVDYLEWRYKTNVTEELEYYLSLEDGKEFRNEFKNGWSYDLYWYGVDKDGCPNLWYRADLTDFDKVEVKKASKTLALILQAAVDKMPSKIHNFNFIIVFDEFNLFTALRKPTLAPSFIKTFVKISPDRLKSAYFITGTAGTIFYDIAKKIAPASIMNKTIKCKSRAEAASLLKSAGILDADEIPTFMKGNYEQDENVIKNYFNMIENIDTVMRNKVISSKAFVCKGSF